MDLSTYIEKHGIEHCADRWGVSVRAVRAYRYGERRPRFDQARKIVERSGGDLSFETIYAEAPRASTEHHEAA